MRGGRGIAVVVLLVGQHLPAQVADDVMALRDPTACAAATERLLAAGAAALPALRACLRDASAPGSQLIAALFVLGRSTGSAFAALDDVQHLYRMHPDAGVRRQALWAIGNIGATVRDRALARQLRTFVVDRCAADADALLLDVVVERLRLAERGNLPDERELWDDRLAPTLALAEGIAAGIVPCPAPLRDRLRQRLHAVTDRSCWPWDNHGHLAPATGELAVAGWTVLGEPTAATAIGLLQHWDPAWRRFALDALAAHMEWSPRQRQDVVGRLRDADPGVRQRARELVAAWGPEGLVALWALRHGRGDAGERTAADATADALVRAIVAVDAAAEPALRAIDRALTGGGVAAAAVAGRDARWFAAALRGCPDAATAVALWPLFDATAASAEVIDALLTMAPDEAAWPFVLRALEQCGPVVFALRPDADVLLMRASSGRHRFRGVFGWQAEVLAGAAASAAELRLAAAQTERWHVAARALLELVRRGVVPDAELQAAAQALQGASWPPVTISHGAEWAAGGNRPLHVLELPVSPPVVAEVVALVDAAASSRPRTTVVADATAAIERFAGRLLAAMR